MDTYKSKSSSFIKNRNSKLSRAFQKLINGNNVTRLTLNNVAFFKEGKESMRFDKSEDEKARNRAVMEAMVAKLFAGITSIKGSYAELQMAMNPYNNKTIQAADQSLVDDFQAISELKLCFLKKEFDFSPQVSLMLSEIQEQQSLTKTYGITVRKLEMEFEEKESEIIHLKKQLQESTLFNKKLEKKVLNSSGSLSNFNELQLHRLNPSNFVQFLNLTLRSIRNFAKMMMHEMESAGWDLESAVEFIVESDCLLSKSTHKILAFESFVCKSMFDGFIDQNFTVLNDSPSLFFNKFQNLKSINPRHFLSHNPNSSFAKFTRSKYLHLIHAKMECSLFRNINQRNILNSGGVPDSDFFNAFAEMSKRIWLLHCLAFSIDEDVRIFQVKRNCRFSEVYMESVRKETVFCRSDDFNDAIGDGGGELRVGFTVVPGFMIGKAIVQSRVYLVSPSY